MNHELEMKIPDLHAILGQIRPLVASHSSPEAMEEFDDILDSAAYRAPEEYVHVMRAVSWLGQHAVPPFPMAEQVQKIWNEFIEDFNLYVKMVRADVARA